MCAQELVCDAAAHASSKLVCDLKWNNTKQCACGKNINSVSLVFESLVYYITLGGYGK